MSHRGCVLVKEIKHVAATGARGGNGEMPE